MNRPPMWIILVRGWRRRLVAFPAGAVGALAMPPSASCRLWSCPSCLPCGLRRRRCRRRPVLARSAASAALSAAAVGVRLPRGGAGGGSAPYSWSRPINSPGPCRSCWAMGGARLLLCRRLRARPRASGLRPGAPARSLASASRPNGCAATSSRVFPETRSAWRSARISGSCSPRPSNRALRPDSFLAVLIGAAPAMIATEKSGPRRWGPPAAGVRRASPWRGSAPGASWEAAPEVAGDAAADHAAEPAAGCQVPAREPRRDHAPLSGDERPKPGETGRGVAGATHGPA